MVLRTIDSLAVSAAPSSVDAISTDDVTSSSCSIDSSPVPTDSSSTGTGRRRCLPSLPRQGINAAGVSAGGARMIGLQRKHSCNWPSSSGAVNHRLTDGANHHRLIDGVNHHRSIDNVSHRRSINGVNHRENEVLGGCFNNGVSRLPSERIYLSNNNVNLHRSDLVNHRPDDFVNRRKSDLIKHLPSDTVTQSSTVSSSHHLNGIDSHCPSNGASVHHQSRSVNQSPNDSQSLHNNLNSARNDSVGHHKSELVIHLQRQSDNKPEETSVSHLQSQSDIERKDASVTCFQGQSGIKPKDTGIDHLKNQSDIELKDASINHIQGQSDIKQNDASINHCTSEMKTCNTSNQIPQHHSDKIDHFEKLGVNLNTSKDETLRRGLANDCKTEVIDKSQRGPISRDSGDISSNRHNDCATTFKTASTRPHDNSSEREVVKNNENEVLSLHQRENLNPRNTVRRIHSFCDKLNNSPNDRIAEKKSVPSSNEDFVVYRQKHDQQKLHTSRPISLDENFSPAGQFFGGVRQRKASLDSKFGAQSKAAISNGIAPMEVATGSSAKQEPAFLQRQTNLRGSYFDVSSSSSLYDHEEDFEDDHKENIRNISRSLKQENTFERQGRDPLKTDQTASDKHGSLNYLISSSHDKPNDSQTFSEICQSSVHSAAHDLSAVSSSYNVTNTEGLRTVLKHHGSNSPIQIAASHQKHDPLTSTKKVSEDNHRSPGISEINWTSAEDTDLISLHDSPNPKCPTTTKRTTPTVPPCVPTLHALLRTYRITTVSLVKSTSTDDCGVKLTSVLFVADAVACRRPVGLAPRGKRATKLGSPDGAFRPIAAVETSPGRDVQPQVVMVDGVEDGSVAAAGGNIEEGDVVIEVGWMDV